MRLPRRSVLLAGAVVVVLALGVGTAVAVSGDGVPRGVTLGDVDLSGLSVEQAQERIAAALADAESAPLVLEADGEQLRLDPAKAGLSVDARATAEDAASAGPLDRLRALFGVGRELEPTVDADRPDLERALSSLADGFDRAPREGSISFEETTPVPVLPLAGRELDVEGAADAVVDAYPQEARVEVPVDDVGVETTEDDVREAMSSIAEPAVAAPITLRVEARSLDVEPADIAVALRVEADEEGELAPVLDGAALLESLGERTEAVEDAPVDATFDTSSGTPVVVPSKPGRVLDAEGVRTAVLSVLTDEVPRTATASLVPGEPRVTTEIAQGLGVKEVIATYTSSFPCCQPRVTNIQRIADIVDGYVLRPGDRFDLNGLVGRRDTERGFVPAPQILRGKFVDDVGGGVSQFATALFNGVFFSGLKDIEHQPHSYYISRYPPGREATVSFPQPDLIFENDSPNGVLVDTSYTGTSVTVTFWGTKRYDIRAIEGPRRRVRDFETVYEQGRDCSPTSGGQGFDITVTRVFLQGGAEVKREEFETRYLPQPKIVCGPPPGSRPTSPAPAPASPEPAPEQEPDPAPAEPAPAPSPTG
jgi:vancomycin resistance protein YoaR